jgi:subtilisin family serine protease
VIDVAAGTNGPALSALTGKTVVWATGQEIGSEAAGTTLTATDQATLTNFLGGGGKLVLTGRDALLGIETSPFVTDTLNLNALSDVPNSTTFAWSAGTAFAGEAYDLNSSTATEPDWHDSLTPRNSSAVTQGTYPGPPSYAYINGTSMATPHVTGVAALAASVNPALLSDPVALKNHVMNTGKPVPATSGKTVTGDMVDAEAAVGGGGDTTAPKVKNNTSPANNAIGVSRTANVTATFSEAMDEASVEAPGVVTLKKSSGGAAVAASVTYNPTTKKVILNPNLSLARNTLYSAKVTTGARDLAGNQLDQNSTKEGNQAKTWKFTTVQ